MSTNLRTALILGYGEACGRNWFRLPRVGRSVGHHLSDAMSRRTASRSGHSEHDHDGKSARSGCRDQPSHNRQVTSVEPARQLCPLDIINVAETEIARLKLAAEHLILLHSAVQTYRSCSSGQALVRIESLAPI